MKMRFGLLATLFIVATASAEMTAITVDASVRSFDAKSVEIQIDERRVRVPRELVKLKTLSAGEAIRVTFHGQEMRWLFPKTTARAPASKP